MISSIDTNIVDPIEGVGSNEPISVDDFKHNLSIANRNVGSVNPINMILDKLGIKNLSEITDELKNIDKNKVNIATDDMKKLLGISDDNTGNFISNMISSIADELKNTDLEKGNPMDEFMSIAEKVAMKMKPEIESGKVDMGALLNSTQSLASKMNTNTEEFIKSVKTINSTETKKKKRRHRH